MTLNNDSNSRTFVKARVSGGRESGFTLVEALVGLTILAVGLLGLTALQFTGMRNNHDAYLRSQAILQAYDIVDRMRANRNSARNGQYDIAVDVAAPDATDTSLRAEDLRQWKASLANLPSGDGSIAVAGGVVTVIVRWDESRDNSGTWMTFQTQSQL